MKRKVGIWILSTLAVATLMQTSYAAEKGHHADEKGHSESKGKVKIPGSLSEVWAAVQEHKQELDEVIADKKLKDVHHHAFAIRDLVKAMPGKSKMMSAADKKKLMTGVKTVTKLATQLDHAGDSKNQKATEEAQKKLDTVLKAIEQLYPGDALK